MSLKCNLTQEAWLFYLKIQILKFKQETLEEFDDAQFLMSP